MSCVRKLYKEKGFSDEIVETIIQSWRPYTKCMAHTGNNGYRFVLKGCVIRCVRRMLSLFATIEGYDAGKHPLVCRYVKGIYWDTGAVVRYLGSVTEKSLLGISLKLASLLTILCGQRGREILSVMDIRNTTIEENFLIIRIGDQLKTTGIKFHVGEIKFPVYENANVCPVKLFKQYIDVTKSLRGSTTCLFITTSKPYRPASKDTLARWIKSVLHDASIDMTIFTPHSTRSASTSKAATKVPIETVLKTGGWRSM